MFLSIEGSVTAPRDSFRYEPCPLLPTSQDVLDTPSCRLAIDGTTRPGVFDVLEDTASAYGSVFFEYGVGERLTFGIDAGYVWEDDSWTALAFARRSFQGDGPNVWALEMAAGAGTSFDGSDVTVFRPGLHWGRGTPWGWLGAESYLVHRTDLDGMAYKLDLTAGWNRSDRVAWIAQILTADYPGSDTSVRLAPSHVWKLNDTVRLRTGALADLAGGKEVGVVLATWFEF